MFLPAAVSPSCFQACGERAKRGSQTSCTQHLNAFPLSSGKNVSVRTKNNSPVYVYAPGEVNNHYYGTATTSADSNQPQSPQQHRYYYQEEQRPPTAYGRPVTAHRRPPTGLRRPWTAGRPQLVGNGRQRPTPGGRSERASCRLQVQRGVHFEELQDNNADVAVEFDKDSEMVQQQVLVQHTHMKWYNTHTRAHVNDYT